MVEIISLMRGISFLTRRGSCGVKVPNFGLQFNMCLREAEDGTYQLDDLDEHPVIGRVRHEMEELWRQG